MSNVMIELDSAIIELELAHIKANTMCDALYNDYFDKEDPEEWLLKAYYNESCVKNQILSDYIREMKSSLDKIRQLVETEIDTSRKKQQALKTA